MASFYGGEKNHSTKSSPCYGNWRFEQTVVDFCDNYGGEKIGEREIYGGEKIHIRLNDSVPEKQLEFDKIIDFAFPAGPLQWPRVCWLVADVFA